jgi:hypothetical protein
MQSTSINEVKLRKGTQGTEVSSDDSILSSAVRERKSRPLGIRLLEKSE